MKNIIVSNATYLMIEKAARDGFKGNARQTPSGMWVVPVDDNTFDLLQNRQLAGEEFDDTVQRVLIEVAGAARSHSSYEVFFMDSPEANELLRQHKLTNEDLARAIVEFERAERVPIGTPIGVNNDGFFGSRDKGWRPEDVEKKKPLQFIPWVQILELLGRVPDGTTGEFMIASGPARD